MAAGRLAALVMARDGDVASSLAAAPCQLMQRVRLQTSSSPSNSRAMSTVGNLDDNMGGFPATDGLNVNLAER
ncbi:hypothetical protein D3C72_1828070 [compost metagenome]